MVTNRKNSILALLLAMLVAISMMPLLTQDAFASMKDIDFTAQIKGLKDGKIITGSTISVNVEEAILSHEEMMESYSNYGDDAIEVILKTYSPSGTPYFTYKKSSGTASLKVTADIAHAGYFVNVCIQIGDDLFYSPQIDVIKAANTLSVKGKAATVSYKKLKKKTQYRAVSKIMTFTDKGQGSKTYTLSSAKKGKKSYKKYFSINSSSGKLTIKKKLRKGTYTLKVKVKAKGNNTNDPSSLKTVTIKIKVK